LTLKKKARIGGQGRKTEKKTAIHRAIAKGEKDAAAITQNNTTYAIGCRKKGGPKEWKEDCESSML